MNIHILFDFRAFNVSVSSEKLLFKKHQILFSSSTMDCPILNLNMGAASSQAPLLITVLRYSGKIPPILPLFLYRRSIGSRQKTDLHYMKTVIRLECDQLSVSSGMLKRQPQ